MFLILLKIASYVAVLLAGIVLEAKFGAAAKSDFVALKTEVTTLIAEVRGAKAAATTAVSSTGGAVPPTAPGVPGA